MSRTTASQRKIHCLKTWPGYYADVIDGRKTFEIRRFDRDFRIGDVLVLQEFDPETQKFTGEMESFIITYMLSDPAWVKEDFVVLGIQRYIK
jgi:hypothetical protein